MSGGHFQYGYHNLNEAADSIERDFADEGRYKDEYGRGDWRECDRIGDATPEERPLILAEVASLIKDLRLAALRFKELEWYMSGDTGATSYLKRLAQAYNLEPNLSEG